MYFCTLNSALYYGEFMDCHSNVVDLTGDGEDWGMNHKITPQHLTPYD